MNLDIFRAYDVRGVFGVDFESRDFYQIACAYTDCFQPETVAVGHDVRESSPELWSQVASGFQDSGVDVLNLGQISTDMLYFAAVHYQMGSGVVITASHNPAAFNGMKFVGQHATPISAGLDSLRCVMLFGGALRLRDRTDTAEETFGQYRFWMPTYRTFARL